MKYLKIDSALRTTGTPSNFRLKLPRNVLKGEEFELVYAHIPQTFFTLDETNNTFVFDEGGGPLTCLLTPAYYTNASVLTELQTQLNAVGGLTYTVTLAANTQRISVTVASGTFSLGMNGVVSPLGFVADTGVAGSHTATQLLNLERHQSLLLDVNDTLELEGSGYASTFVIPSDVDTLQVVDYTPSDHFRQTMEFRSDTNMLKVRLKDQGNRDIDLKGAEWYMVLKRT